MLDLYSLWLINDGHHIRYAAGRTKKVLEEFIPKIKVKFDDYYIKPNVDATEQEESCLYDVYIMNFHQCTKSNLDDVVDYFKNYTEEELKHVYIQKIQTFKVELLR